MVSQPFHNSRADLPAGTLVSGRYRLQRELGRGRATVTYQALDIRHGTPVAVRVALLGTQEQARLRREVMAAWEIAHDQVVRVHGLFEEEQRSFVVMDLIAGQDLGTRVGSQGPLSAEEAAAIGRGVALALRAAHRRGILHRQVAPGNILIGPQTRAYLSDFGSAGVGVPPDSLRDFQAPEVTAGQAADVRSDLYSLGLCLYFALTGKLPARQHPDRPPMPAADGHHPSKSVASVPAWLDEAVAAATAALPADRYPSAGRLAEVLIPRAPDPDFRPSTARISLRA